MQSLTEVRRMSKWPKRMSYLPKTSATAFTMQKVKKGALNISLAFSLLKIILHSSSLHCMHSCMCLLCSVVNVGCTLGSRVFGRDRRQGTWESGRAQQSWEAGQSSRVCWIEGSRTNTECKHICCIIYFFCKSCFGRNFLYGYLQY